MFPASSDLGDLFPIFLRPQYGKINADIVVCRGTIRSSDLNNVAFPAAVLYQIWRNRGLNKESSLEKYPEFFC